MAGKKSELSNKQARFLREWHRNGGQVSEACRQAGYTQPNQGFRILKTDDDGNYLDPRVTKFLDALDQSQAIEAVVEPPSQPKRQPQTLTYVDTLQPPPCPDEGPTTEWQIQVQAWILADPNSSSNSKVNASRELRALMSQSTQRAPDPQKAIAILRKKMIPHVPPAHLKKS